MIIELRSSLDWNTSSITIVSPVRPTILSTSERAVTAPLGESNLSMPGINSATLSPSSLTSITTPM